MKPEHPLESAARICTKPAQPIELVAVVIDNLPLARGTFRISLEAPELAYRIRPGQFVMLRATPGYDPLLARPLALWDLVRHDSDEPVGIELVYQVFGRGTAELSVRRPGDRLSIWGPLGNGFARDPQVKRIVMVAGGIGQTPFLALAKWWLGLASYGETSTTAPPMNTPTSLELCYGARTSAYFAGLDEFQAIGFPIHLSTDDGSRGFHGRVTDLLEHLLVSSDAPNRIVGCGPKPMLSALSRLAAEKSIRCDVSLENHMACGFGACFSCVAPVRTPSGLVDLKRVCVEGPVFDSRDLAWD